MGREDRISDFLLLFFIFPIEYILDKRGAAGWTGLITSNDGGAFTKWSWALDGGMFGSKENGFIFQKNPSA